MDCLAIVMSNLLHPLAHSLLARSLCATCWSLSGAVLFERLQAHFSIIAINICSVTIPITWLVLKWPLVIASFAAPVWLSWKLARTLWRAISFDDPPDKQQYLIRRPTSVPPDSFSKGLTATSAAYIAEHHPALEGVAKAGHLVAFALTRGASGGVRLPEEVFLVGTAHISPNSVTDVDSVVAAIKPDAVVVELCEGRKPILMMDPVAPRRTWATC